MPFDGAPAAPRVPTALMGPWDAPPAAPLAVGQGRQRPTAVLLAGWGAMALAYAGLSFLINPVSFAWELAWWGFLFFPIVPWWLNRRALRGVEATLAAAALPAGEVGWIEATVGHRGRLPLSELDAWLDGAPARVAGALPARSALAVPLPLPALARGVHRIGALQLETRFPYGLFRARRAVAVDATVTVWPRLEPQAPAWPAGTAIADPARMGEDVVGFRDYTAGDPLSSVDWKLSARQGAFVVRQFEAPHRPCLQLSLAQVSDLPLEDGLSRLAAWVDRAEAQGLAYALSLADADLPLGHGADHRARCMAALAAVREAP